MNGGGLILPGANAITIQIPPYLSYKTLLVYSQQEQLSRRKWQMPK